MSTLVCAEEGATGAYSYDAPTLRHSGTQGAPYLHWARPRWCMERRRLHLGYRNHSDCPGCRSLWGEQDRHRRCEHHHVSAPHDWPRRTRTHRAAVRVARERSVVVAEYDARGRGGQAPLWARSRSRLGSRSPRCASSIISFATSCAAGTVRSTRPSVCNASSNALDRTLMSSGPKCCWSLRSCCIGTDAHSQPTYLILGGRLVQSGISDA